MPVRQREPLPAQVMPEHKAAPPRPPLRAALFFFLGVFVVLAVYPESFLHKLLFSGDAFSWRGFLAALSGYGYWLFSAYVAFVAIALFLENKNPDRTVAWLLVLGLLPVLGLLLYWIMGPNFRTFADKRRFRLAKPKASGAESIDEYGSPLVADTVQLAYRSSGAKVLQGLDTEIYGDGKEAFAAIRTCLAAAKRSILLESYTIENDGLGNAIRETLEAKAREGVAVCVLYDAVGSWRIGKSYLASLRAAGVTAYAFFPVSFPMFRGANYRNHRKIIVVDGEVAFMGGMNIGDAYVNECGPFSYWRDTHMKYSGPAVARLRSVFLNDLALCGADSGIRQRLAEASALPDVSTGQDAGGVPIQTIVSGPDMPWDTIQKAYFSVIARARRNIWLTTPYLVPGDSLMEALSMASLTGVDVRILIPGKADHLLVYWASCSVCDDLLRAGVRIFLYDESKFVHAKTLTCDGEILSVGTANLDTRSLHINFEVQNFMYDRDLARQGEEAFRKDMENSRELTLESWRRRSPVQKVKERAGRLFSSLL